MNTIFLELDGQTLLLAYIIGAGVAWAIFYYTIKAAVKNGTLEAMREKDSAKGEAKG